MGIVSTLKKKAIRCVLKLRSGISFRRLYFGFHSLQSHILLSAKLVWFEIFVCVLIAVLLLTVHVVDHEQQIECCHFEDLYNLLPSAGK